MHGRVRLPSSTRGTPALARLLLADLRTEEGRAAVGVEDDEGRRISSEEKRRASVEEKKREEKDLCRGRSLRHRAGRLRLRATAPVMPAVSSFAPRRRQFRLRLRLRLRVKARHQLRLRTGRAALSLCLLTGAVFLWSKQESGRESGSHILQDSTPKTTLPLGQVLKRTFTGDPNGLIKMLNFEKLNFLLILLNNFLFIILIQNQIFTMHCQYNNLIFLNFLGQLNKHFYNIHFYNFYVIFYFYNSFF